MLRFCPVPIVAILVWFNYKTTYEYWNEQMQDALPLGSRALTATPVTNKLFLEVKAIDMGICLPLKSSSVGIHMCGRVGVNYSI